MNTSFTNSLFFFAAEASATITSREFDWPESPSGWILLLGGGCVLTLWVVGLSFRDTRDLATGWKLWLTSLRLSVLAGLLLIAINPSDRTQKQSFRPSRIALIVDTSLSMRHPAAPSAADLPTESNAGISRSEAVARLLADSSLIERLCTQHEVSLFTFDSTLNGPQRVYPLMATPSIDAKKSDNPPRDWNELLRPRGLETRLGESLSELIRQVAGRTLSGIVIITDGASNAGIDVMTAHDRAISTKTRLIAVGTGTTEQPVNLSIVEVVSPTDVAINDPFEIKVFVQGQGLTGREVDVELLSLGDGEQGEPTPIEKKSVMLLEEGVRTEVPFPRLPTVAARTNYTVRVTARDRVMEFNAQDNSQTFSVNVFDRPTKVLLLAGGPMRDYQFVRNLLFRHKSFDVDVLLQTGSQGTSQESNNLLLNFPATREQLYAYDAIIAFDPDWKSISSDALPLLYDWVATESGGIILVAGDVNTPQIASGIEGREAATDELLPLRNLYPVFLSSYFSPGRLDQEASQPWPIVFTPEGWGADFLQLTDDPITSAARWKEFAGFFRAYPTGGHKAAARIFARFPDPRAVGELSVLMAGQNVGRGQSFYLGSAEMWRLRAVSDEDYDRFWIKLIREVAQGRTKKGVKRGSLRPESQKATLGQTVRVLARLLDPQFAPLELESVPLDVFDPTGRPLTPIRQLRREPAQPGEYVGDFRASLPGTYKLEIVVPESTDRLSAEVAVAIPKLEDENIRQNVRLLTDLVRETGGQYLAIDQAAEELPALLPNRGEQFFIPERLRTLWDRDWVMYLLVGLLSAEWLTRKLLKLA
ncbi:MAG: hypothetical protein NTW75_16865 [Planctomycetales bacterium]|jgi:hypothetical protein|nr:hypothetical protein [Planctomycetales bacterium]